MTIDDDLDAAVIAQVIAQTRQKGGVTTELREVAGMAAHAARCKQAGPNHHPPEACRTEFIYETGEHVCVLHGIVHPYPCEECDPLMRHWPDLTETQREAFRASQDPGLSVLAPAALAALRALAREPGGAEAVAEAVGLVAIKGRPCSCTCKARIVAAVERAAREAGAKKPTP